MRGDRLGDRLPAGHPGANELEHVRGVQTGTGRALRRSPIPAAHMHTEWVVGAGEAGQHLTGRGIDPLGGAAQRMGRTQFFPRASASAQAPKSSTPAEPQPAATSRVTGRPVSGCRGRSPRRPSRCQLRSRLAAGLAWSVRRVHGHDHHRRGCAARLSANPRRSTPSLGVWPTTAQGGEAFSAGGSQPHREATVRGVGSQRSKCSVCAASVSGPVGQVGSRPQACSRVVCRAFNLLETA